MKRKLFITLMVLSVVMSGCKKTVNEINETPLEIGEIKNNIVTSAQAEKIAVFQSIYPENLTVSPNKKSGTSLLSSNSISAQKPKSKKSIKNTFSIKEGQVNPTII